MKKNMKRTLKTVVRGKTEVIASPNIDFSRSSFQWHVINLSFLLCNASLCELVKWFICVYDLLSLNCFDFILRL